MGISHARSATFFALVLLGCEGVIGGGEPLGNRIGQSPREAQPQLARGSARAGHHGRAGASEDVIAHRGVIEAGFNFIQKPFSVKHLAARVREVLEK